MKSAIQPDLWEERKRKRNFQLDKTQKSGLVRFGLAYRVSVLYLRNQ